MHWMHFQIRKLQPSWLTPLEERKLNANLKNILHFEGQKTSLELRYQTFLNCGFLTTNQTFIYISKYFLKFFTKIEI